LPFSTFEIQGILKVSAKGTVFSRLVLSWPFCLSEMVDLMFFFIFFFCGGMLAIFFYLEGENIESWWISKEN
jgi:hypothetical protein